jgi:DNA-binding beta-propeller fold protein YncE
VKPSLYPLREVPQSPVSINLPRGVRQLVFLPEGNKAVLVVNDFHRDKRFLQVVELPSGQEVKKILLPDFPPLVMAVLPDGQTAVAGGADDRFLIDPAKREFVHLVSLKSGKIVRAVPGPRQAINALAVSKDGTLLAIGEASPAPAVRVIDLPTGAERFVKAKAHKNTVYAVAITPDNKYLVSTGVDAGGANQNSRVIVWDLATGEELRVLKEYRGVAEGMAVSADGKLVAAAMNEPTRGGSVRLWDIETGTEKLALIGQGLGREAHRVCFGPEDKTVIAVFYNNTIRVYDAKTGDEVGGFRGHTLAPDLLSVSPDGKTVASICAGELKLWAFPDSLRWLAKPGQPEFIRIVREGKEVPSAVPAAPEPGAKTFATATVEGTRAKTIVYLTVDGRPAEVHLQPTSKFFDAGGKAVPAAEASRIYRIGNVVSVKTRPAFADQVVEMRLVKDGPDELTLDKVTFKELGRNEGTFRTADRDRGVVFAKTLRLLNLDGQPVDVRPDKFLKFNQPYSVKLRFEVGADQPLLTEVRQLPKEPIAKLNPLDRPGARAVKNAKVLRLTEKGTTAPGLAEEGQPPYMVSTAGDATAFDKDGKPIPLGEALRPGNIVDAVVQKLSRGHQLLEIRVQTAAAAPEPAPANARKTTTYKNVEVFKFKNGPQTFLKVQRKNIQVVIDATSKAFDRDGNAVPAEQVLQNGNRVDAVVEHQIPLKATVVEVRPASES